mgnify:FL=1
MSEDTMCKPEHGTQNQTGANVVAQKSATAPYCTESIGKLACKNLKGIKKIKPARHEKIEA